MKALKLYKSIARRVFLPIIVGYAILVAIIGRYIGNDDLPALFEIVNIACAFAVAGLVAKECFAVSNACGVSRTSSFSALLLSAITATAIIMAAHLAECIMNYRHYLGLYSVTVRSATQDCLPMLSFADSVGYMWFMLFIRTMLAFASGLAFFIIMSRLERVGKLINCGVIVILFAVNLSGDAFTTGFDTPVLSYEFFYDISEKNSVAAFTFTYAVLLFIAAMVAYLAWRRKPVKAVRGVR